MWRWQLYNAHIFLCIVIMWAQNETYEKSKQKQRKKERKIRFLCCKICSIYQLSDLCKNYEKIYHYIALHLLTLIKSGGNKTISINIFGESKRKREQLHYKLYCDFMEATLCLVFRCKLFISCRHFSYVWLEFWLFSSLLALWLLSPYWGMCFALAELQKKKQRNRSGKHEPKKQ